MDADTYRDESHERWERAAGAWGKHRDLMQRIAQPISIRMLDLIAPQPGQTILELACGVGDTGLLAAELVQPAGKVILSDWAEPMLDAARARAAEVGAGNVEFKVIDAESIDLDTASIDGVLCRWGYMLMADPAAALQETRRVLKPGARVALAAWDGPDQNRWASEIGRALVQRGLTPVPEPGAPGMFAFGRPGLVEALLDDAGFSDVAVESVAVTYEFESFEGYWTMMHEINRGLADAVGKVSEDEARQLHDALEQAFASQTAEDGSLALPGASLVASATA